MYCFQIIDSMLLNLLLESISFFLNRSLIFDYCLNDLTNLLSTLKNKVINKIISHIADRNCVTVTLSLVTERKPKP